MNLAKLLEVAKRSPVVALCVLVWWELHEMRGDIGGMRADIAVLVDRARIAER